MYCCEGEQKTNGDLLQGLAGVDRQVLELVAVTSNDEASLKIRGTVHGRLDRQKKATRKHGRVRGNILAEHGLEGDTAQEAINVIENVLNVTGILTAGMVVDEDPRRKGPNVGYGTSSTVFVKGP